MLCRFCCCCLPRMRAALAVGQCIAFLVSLTLWHCLWCGPCSFLVSLSLVSHASHHRGFLACLPAISLVPKCHRDNPVWRVLECAVDSQECVRTRACETKAGQRRTCCAWGHHKTATWDMQPWLHVSSGRREGLCFVAKVCALPCSVSSSGPSLASVIRPVAAAAAALPGRQAGVCVSVGGC